MKEMRKKKEGRKKGQKNKEERKICPTLVIYTVIEFKFECSSVFNFN